MKPAAPLPILTFALCFGCEHRASTRPIGQATSNTPPPVTTIGPSADSLAGASADSSARAGGVGAGATFKASRLLGRACALDETSVAYCWGPPAAPLPERDGDGITRRVPELDHARALTKSAFFSYFLDEAGKVYVWGTQRHSYLGDVNHPRLLPKLDHIKELGAFDELVHALRADGALFGWNDSFVSDEPGEPGTVLSNPPEVEAKDALTLALPGNAYYLGRDSVVHQRRNPSHPTVTGTSELRSITDCSGLSCGLDAAGRARCWTPRGQAPIDLVGSAPFVALGCANRARIFALMADGNVVAQLDVFSPMTLVQIPTLQNVAELAFCDGTLACPHCVKLKDNSVSCWGEGPQRRFGSGTWPTDPHLVPLQKGRDVTTPRAK